MVPPAPIGRIAVIAAIAALAWAAAACHRPAPSPSAGPPDLPVARGPASGSASGDDHAGPPGTPDDPLCDVAECGPRIRMPSRRCSDGSVGGPTDRCLRKPDGRCAWEVRPCPPG
jgi:hypothetical protein